MASTPLAKTTAGATSVHGDSTDWSRTARKPIKAVIRDPYFTAATVITVKRQPL